MSIKIMTQVWTRDILPAEKIILLAMTDWADDDGGNMYPSLGKIAHKTGYTRRYIRERISSFVSKGWLFRQKWSIYGTYVYQINIVKIPGLAPYEKPVSSGAEIRRKGQPNGAEVAPQ